MLKQLCHHSALKSKETLASTNKKFAPSIHLNNFSKKGVWVVNVYQHLQDTCVRTIKLCTSVRHTCMALICSERSKHSTHCWNSLWRR